MDISSFLPFPFYSLTSPILAGCVLYILFSLFVIIIELAQSYRASINRYKYITIYYNSIYIVVGLLSFSAKYGLKFVLFL